MAGNLARTIEAKLKITQEGDVQVIGKSADELEHLAQKSGEADKAAAGLGKAWEKTANDIAAGSSRSTADIAKVGVALENYEQKLKAAEAAGATIGVAQREQLAKLKTEYDGAVRSVAQFEVAEQRAKKAVEDATLAAGGHVKTITSEADLLRELSEALGDNVAKFAIWGTAAVGAFSVGYEAGTKLKKLFDDLSDGAFSKNMQESLRGLAERFAGLDKSINTTSEHLRVLNEANVLAKHGIDVTGMSVEQVDAAYRKYTGELATHRGEIDKQDAAYKKWEASIQPVGKALDAAANQLVEFVKKFEQSHQELSKEQFAAAIGKQVDEMVQKLRDGGRAIPPILQQIDSEYKQHLANAVPQSLAAAKEAHDKYLTSITKALDDWVRSIGAVSPALAEAAAQAGLFVPPWQQMVTIFSTFPKSVDDTGQAIANLNKAMAEQETTVQQAISAAERLRTTLDGVGTSADNCKQKISNVFQDYGGDTEPLEPDRGPPAPLPPLGG